MKKKLFLFTLLHIFFVECGMNKNVEDPSILDPVEKTKDVVDENNGDEDGSDGDAIEYKEKANALNDCYLNGTAPNAKTKICIEKFLKNPDKYLKSAKFYGDKISEGVDRKAMLLHRQPVNIVMGNSNYDNVKWKKELKKYGLPDSIDPAKSFYTEYFEKNNKLAPAVAVYTLSPMLNQFDKGGNEIKDKDQWTTEDVGILSVSAYGFDNENQPDRRYFLKEKVADSTNIEYDKQKFKTPELLAEFEKRERSIFDKIIKCAKDHRQYKKIVIGGFGCSYFGGPVMNHVKGLWWKILEEYREKYKAEFDIIAAHDLYNDLELGGKGTIENMKNIFDENYDKALIFKKQWRERLGGDLSKVLLTNSWDPHSLPGNGNNSDRSADGGYGRNAPIALIGYPGINGELLKEENYITVSS